jgi:agmatinase
MSLEEYNFAEQHPKITMFCHEKLTAERFSGRSWAEVCDTVVAQLPSKVYISFDIDALSPECCPHTKRPVAGGMTFDEAVCLINRVAESGREIVGFDLTEIVPVTESGVDAAVGARMLVKLCAAALCSKK